MFCTAVDNCETQPTQRYEWSWGQTGATCDEHRATLESQSAQLQRAISFAPIEEPLTDPGRPRPWRAPTLQKLDPELGRLKIQNAELLEKVKKLEESFELPETIEMLRRENDELREKVAELDAALRGAQTRVDGPGNSG